MSRHILRADHEAALADLRHELQVAVDCKHHAVNRAALLADEVAEWQRIADDLREQLARQVEATDRAVLVLLGVQPTTEAGVAGDG